MAAATGVTTGTRDREEVAGLGLYPNPVTADTRLAFTLASSAQVTMVVTDALGRQVDRIEAGRLGAGTQGIRWNSASNLRQGVYFFQLLLDGKAAGTQRGVLLN
ncbi:T9SS type A sorting domain-containing protein [Hymenobacter cellulosivorans]|uniref:T9SS type A sorting domain-containing protein n=1 Tax=Hymenobacter cellulosivorans TaxID=2932249 RepID=UPI0035CC96B0